MSHSHNALPKNRTIVSRRQLLAISAAGIPCLAGCMSPWFRNDIPTEKEIRRTEIREALKAEDRPRLLREVVSKQELTMAALENVALVTGLVSTGGKVKPSGAREELLSLMKLEETDRPNAIIDSDSTAMVTTSVAVPPAARKGATMDVFINLSQQANASDLANGRVFKTPLLEISRLGGRVRKSFENAKAAGTIVTVEQATGSELPEDKLRGSIIGGARLSKQREIGLSVRTDLADAYTVKKILDAVETRFTIFDGRSHVGAGTPVRDSYIALDLPKRYELDPFHFVSVAINLGFNESAQELAERQSQLARQILDPLTVQQACWELEAIGEPALTVLATGLESPDPSVRFFAAHSMAYLDDKRAIEALKQASVSEPAFRLMALNALSIMEHFEAETALRSLLHVAEPETRYGAVRALRHRDKRDPQVTSQELGGDVFFLDIPTDGPNLVAVSLTKQPEIVVFGPNPSVVVSEFIYANPWMLIRPESDGTLSVSHFVPGMPDRVESCPSDLRSVLAAITKVGGRYGDCVKFVREAAAQAAIAEQVAMNPVPVSGRVYDAVQETEVDSSEIMESIEFEDAAKVEAAAEKEPTSFSIIQPSTWWQE